MTKQAEPSRYDREALHRRYERCKRQALREPARFKLPKPDQWGWARSPDLPKLIDEAWQLRIWEAVASVIDAARNERDEFSFSNLDLAAAVMSMTLLEWQREAPLGSAYFAQQRTDLYSDLLLVGEHRFNFNIGGRLAEIDGLQAPSGEHIRVIVEQVLEANQKNYTPAITAAARFWRFVAAQRKLLQRRLRSGALVHEAIAHTYLCWGELTLPKAGDRWWLILQ